MTIALSAKAGSFTESVIREMTRLSLQHGAVNLAQGFPDFDGPEFAKNAAIQAIREGHGQYARMSGTPELARVLSAKYRRDYALDYDPDSEITVTSGATEAIFSALQGVCEPGDAVVLFEPYYDSYRAAVAMALVLLVARPGRIHIPAALPPFALAGLWLFELHRFSIL